MEVFAVNQVGLRFLLESGHFINVAVTEDEAVKTINNWKEGKLPEVIAHTRVPSPQGSLSWSVRTKAIVAIHTVDLSQMMQGIPATQPGLPPPSSGMSGYQYRR